MRRLTPLPASREAAAAQRRTALLDARVAASVTATLAQRASSYGTSVHGALAAAALLAIGVELRGGKHARRDNIGCATPIDLRRRSMLSPALVGNLVSRVVSAHAVHYDTLFWDLAAEVSGALRAASASGAAVAYACMKEAKGMGVRDADLAKRVRKAERYNRAAVVVNNLGLLDPYPRYGGVTLERLGFLVSNNAYVGSSLVLSAATFGAWTWLNFTFAEPLLDADRAQRLVDGTLARLHDAAR